PDNATATIRYTTYGNEDEFVRQLRGQQRGLNEMTAGEIRARIEQFRANGRPSSSESALTDEQEQTVRQSEGDLARLHNPDLCIAGKNCVVDVGDSRINSSIGSQNRTRQQQIYDAVKDLPSNQKVRLIFRPDRPVPNQKTGM